MGEMEAAIPVDRVCDFIERGLNAGSHDTTGRSVLFLLAKTGHQRAGALIDYVCSTSAFGDTEKSKKNREELTKIQTMWKHANSFVKTGKSGGVKTYEVTRRMRELFEKDPKCIEWNGKP